MSYYKVLGLEKEPFSTSPDPTFFYQSQKHKAALTNILIEIRLKRGLSVILGDVGTGKTTLSRKLFQLLKEREDIIFHMVLDPTYESDYIFLLSLAKSLDIPIDENSTHILNLKSKIKDYLYKKGVGEGKTVVLIIDEAQKLNSASLEVLRVLLNYETNKFKLLQLVLLGQMELLPRLVNTKNLMDRISLKDKLGPFSEQETREMIKFRIKQAGYKGSEDLFTDGAVKEIYKYTKGLPRRVAMICHKSLKKLVMDNKSIVTKKIVKEIIERDVRLGWQKENLLLKNSY